MRLTTIIILLFLFFCSEAQESGLLQDKVLISDISGTPIYERLVENDNGVPKWKAKYKYLDSIAMYRITYLSDGLKVKGLLVKPKKKGNYPCVIYNRGGNKDFGSLKVAHGVFTLGRIAKNGYVVIASQYRGNGGSQGKEEFGGSDVNDVIALTEVLKEIEGADTTKIGMYGWSRGGMMTYLALTKSTKIKAAIVGGAISNAFEMVKDRPEMESKVMAGMIPGFHKNRAAELTKRSAIKWADKFPEDVPILILHGNSDWRVKAEHSLKLALEFEKHRVPYRLIIYEGGEHSIQEHKSEVNAQVISWFDRYLKNGEAPPNMEYHGR